MRSRRAATPSSRRPTWRASPARPSSSLTRCGRRGRRCRSTRTCATAAATGAGATRASSSTASELRLVPQRAHWQPIEYNALHGGIERWFEPIEAARPRSAGVARGCRSRFAALALAAEGRAAVVRRGAPVPHRHDRRHRPADARGRAPRRRRLRRRRPRRPRRHQGRRDARVRRRRPRRASASRCSSRGPRCCSTTPA